MATKRNGLWTRLANALAWAQSRLKYSLLLVLGILVGFVAGWLQNAIASPFDEEPGGGPVKVVAMGDSYISGEGATQFFRNTDNDSNRCRRAPTAYPYAIKRILDLNLVFTACSGAKTTDIMTRAQYPSSNSSVFGGQPQIDVLGDHDDVDIVLLSVGGNDAKFGEIGHACALRRADCRANADDWLQNLEVVGARLVDTYSAVKAAAPEAEVFVMTYPNPFGSTYCRDIPTISRGEYFFLRDEFIPALNDTIRAAARSTEVSLIDLEDAFDTRRICEAKPKDAAINIVGLSRRSAGDFQFGRAFHNSFHPNALGHIMFARIVSPRIVGACTSRPEAVS